MMFAALLVALPLFADVDWQPIIDSIKTLLATGNTGLLVWVLSKQRGNDKDTKVARNAGLATAAAAGVTPDVLPEVQPMREAVNGSGMSARMGKLENDMGELRKLVTEAVKAIKGQ